MPCAEWYTSVDSRRLPTVELKSKAFLAVDSGACQGSTRTCVVREIGGQLNSPVASSLCNQGLTYVRVEFMYSQGALSSRPPGIGSEAATKGTGY
eukprot:8888752-Pyramimonas_sp.AAC.2